MLLLTVVLICASSLLVSAQTIEPRPVAGQCYLEGFDLKTLTSVDHWQFKVDTVADYLVPPGVANEDIATVEVYFAVCKPLPISFCTDSISSSICQRITLKNSSTYDLEMGSYDSSDSFKTIQGGDVGFYEFQTSASSVNTTSCKQNVETEIIWRGNSQSVWNSASPDITAEVTVFERIVGDNCLFQIQFNYAGALFVQPTLAPSSCSLDNYDTQTLAAADFWWAEVPHTVCYNGSEDQSCTVFFSFCHVLPKTGGALFDLSECYYKSAAVCQIGHDKNDQSKVLEYSMGKFKSYTRFYENEYDVGGGFHLDVTNGSRPDNGSTCKTFLKTRIILSCNSSAVWPSSGDLTGMVVSYYDEQCQYTLEIQYNGACLPPGTLVDPPSPVGWIFIGIFLFGCILYMLIGMAVQYFVKGARGLDVVPNYKFWTLVFSYILEGFSFTLNVVTCFMFKKGISRPKGGVQYDQI